MSEVIAHGCPAITQVRSKGQALTEFALVFVLFFLLVAVVMQFGLILWSANTVTQVARDTARWDVTQPSPPCSSSANRVNLAGHADTLAQQWGLLGYKSGMWTTASLGIDTVGAEGVGAEWHGTSPIGVPLVADDCPPADASTPWFVRVRVNHVVPVFFPGVQIFLPPCAGSGLCLSSTAELRMEPKAP